MANELSARATPALLALRHGLWLDELVKFSLPSGHLLPGFMLTAALASGCVSQGKYDELVKAGQQRQMQDYQAQQALTAQLAEARAAIEQRDAKLGEVATSQHNMQVSLDETMAMNQQLRQELVLAGRDSSALLAGRGTVSPDDTNAMAGILRIAKTRADKVASTIRNSGGNAATLLANGLLRVEVRHSRAVILVSGEQLFALRRAPVTPAGAQLLGELARVFIAAGQPENRQSVLVTTHVDDSSAAKTPKAVMELGAARALSVVDKMLAGGMTADQLLAATAGPNDPIEARDTIGNHVVELAF